MNFKDKASEGTKGMHILDPIRRFFSQHFFQLWQNCYRFKNVLVNILYLIDCLKHNDWILSFLSKRQMNFLIFAD